MKALPLTAVLVASLVSAQGMVSYVGDGKSSVGRRRGSPYSATPIKVAWLGDSITQYAPNADPPPRALELQLLDHNNYDVDNYGISGDITSGMLTRYQASIQNGGYAWLVMLGGVNDIKGSYLATEGPTAAAANIRTVVEDAAGRGMYVVLLRVMPFKNYFEWTLSSQTALEVLNVAISDICADNVARVTCIDTYAAFGDALEPRALKAEYNADGLHPNAAGAYYLATLVKERIEP